MWFPVLLLNCHYGPWQRCGKPSRPLPTNIFAAALVNEIYSSLDIHQILTAPMPLSLTRVNEQWESVPITPMWHTCLIRHSNSSTAVLITIEMSEKEAVPMHMGNKLVVAFACLVATWELWHSCHVMPEGRTMWQSGPRNN